MAVLPGSLALNAISDGALATAADLRNNFTAIQTEANALLGILDDGASGQFLAGVGTTLSWLQPPGTELARTQITANVTVSGTSGAQTTLIGPTSSVTFDGATAVDIDVASPLVQTGAVDTVTLELYEDSTSIGVIGQVLASGAAGSVVGAPVRVTLRRTPSAAAHTYTLKGYRITANGLFVANTGGPGNFSPAFIKVVKV